ncbi:MAG: tetratricopeptide repeat protein, partial [Chloroflexales bacterium]|nr:tetratricopeptide repeat protein [Chloroflexales bacterium]
IYGPVVGANPGSVTTSYYTGPQYHLPSASAPIAPAFQTPYPPNPLFTGRMAELDNLAAILLDGAGQTAALLPAITGLGGIGKTQLAAEFTHRYRDRFPGGVFWLNMAQPETVAGQVAACAGPGGLDLPGWPALDFDARIAAVKRAWNEPTIRLLVFDNLEDPGLLSTWRPAGGGTRVLLTSRRGVWSAASGVQRVPLQPLERAASVRLLLAPRAQAVGTTVAALLMDANTAPAAGAVGAAVGDLPLALALAGAYLERNPSISVACYLVRLDEQALAHPSLGADLGEALPTEHATSVAATIALSYDQLDPAQATDAQARSLLTRLAWCAPMPIPQRLGVRLCIRDPDVDDAAETVDPLLRRLRALGLVKRLADGAVALHRLVGAFVHSRDEAGAAAPEVVLAALIDESDALLRAGYPLAAIPLMPHLEAAAGWMDGRGDGQGATLLNNLGLLLQAQGDLARAGPYLDRALAIREQRFDPDHLAMAISLNNLALLLKRQGEYAVARSLYERVLAIREQWQGPDHPETAASLHNLAGLRVAMGDLAGARPLYERALAIREQALGRAHPETARSLDGLAVVLKHQRDYTGACLLYERALAIRTQVQGPAHPNTAVSLHNLAMLLAALGAYTAARPLVEQALGIVEQALGPQHPETARSLHNLGLLLQDLGDLSGARSYLERALAIDEAVYGAEHPEVATDLHNLGAVLQDLGDWAGARLCLARALAIQEQALGPQHPDTQAMRQNLVALDAAQEP